MSDQDGSPPVVRPRPTLLLLAIAYLGFISLGLPDAIGGVAWPRLHVHFDVPRSALGWIFVASGLGYFTTSFLAGRLHALFGTGGLLTASSLLVALAMLGTAVAPAWLLLLLLALVWGCGSGAIDAALNTYAAHHFSARQMNWLHACYSIGASIGTTTMTMSIALLHSWQTGYAIVGTLMFGMTVLFLTTFRQWDAPSSTDRDEDAPPAVPTGMFHTLTSPPVVAQIALFFLYGGLESTVGQWTFTVLTESRGIIPHAAGIWVTTYYASIGIGRLLAGFLTERLGTQRLVGCALVGAVIGTVLIAVPYRGPLFIAGLVLTGLSLAPLFPTWMSLTPQRVGAAHATNAIGFQVAATIGGIAFFPLLAGQVAERVGLAFIPWLAVLLSTGLLLVEKLMPVAGSLPSASTRTDRDAS